MQEQYTELHVYDFDDTLYKTMPYDSAGVNSKWIQYILNDGILNFVRKWPDRFDNKIDINLFSINSDHVYDVDSNRRYEVLYDNKPWPAALYKTFNSKIRKHIEPGTSLKHESVNPDSYYISIDPTWYTTPKNFKGGDIIWNPTGNAFKKSMARKDVYVILLTGRRNEPDMYTAISEILKKNNLIPDEMYLSPGGSTIVFKIKEIERILNEHPSIQRVIIWEDRNSQKDKFERHFNQNVIDVTINMVTTNKFENNLHEFIARVIHKQA